MLPLRSIAFKNPDDALGSVLRQTPRRSLWSRRRTTLPEGGASGKLPRSFEKSIRHFAPAAALLDRELAIARKLAHAPGVGGGSTKSMASLEEARRRLEAAVTRLETMVATNRNGKLPAGGGVDGDDHSLRRDVELLGAECDSLRRALEVSEAQNRRLAETADDVAARLGRTIDELSELVEG